MYHPADETMTIDERPGVPCLVLGPMLRWVDDTHATVWVETSRPCTVEVLGHCASTFTIGTRCYALVVVSGLEPGSTTPYEVHLDTHRVWPDPELNLPDSTIRTTGGSGPIRVLIGSCRAAAPHVVPYTRDLAFNAEGRGVDSLWAHARRMMQEDPAVWPSLVVFAGDQIYSDDSSPKARERIKQRRADQPTDLEETMVCDFEEYSWLYHEAWSSRSERWLLSTVPSAMIFDDHDMVDDWNISESWITDMEDVPTWEERATFGYMSYWVYQHLGNLSPSQIEEDGMLDQLLAVENGTDILRAWAERCFASSGSAEGHQFSHIRQVDDVTVITIDCRSGRVLDDGERLMVQPSEWERVKEAAHDAPGHIIFVTSVPVFLTNGIHDLHTWNTEVCEGAWGALGRRLGEGVRRYLDLEDWPAFPVSLAAFVEHLSDLRASSEPPRSILVVSGDIHFSYAARVPEFSTPSGPDVWQIVSSPIRNALIPHERSAMRFATTRAGGVVGSALRRSARGSDTRANPEVVAGPYFANNMVQLNYNYNDDNDCIEVIFEQSTSIDDGDDPDLTEVGRLTI